MIRVSVVKLRDDVDGILANATKTSSNFECDSLAAESTLTLLCAFLLQPFQEKGEVMERSTVGTISSLGRCTNFDKAALHVKSERPWKMLHHFPHWFVSSAKGLPRELPLEQKTVLEPRQSLTQPIAAQQKCTKKFFVKRREFFKRPLRPASAWSPSTFAWTTRGSSLSSTTRRCRSMMALSEGTPSETCARRTSDNRGSDLSFRRPKRYLSHCFLPMAT